MPQETEGKGGGKPTEGLGLGRLAMGQVASSEVQAPSESVSPKVWRPLLGVLLVVALAGLAAWWFRVGSGMFTSQEEAEQLSSRLKQTRAWQYGILRGVELKRADTAVLEVAPPAELDALARDPEVAAWARQMPVQVTDDPTPSVQRERGRLRKLAALEALAAFREVQPSRDLHVVLMSQGAELGEGEHYRRDGPEVLRKGRVHLEEEAEVGAARGGQGRE